MKDPIVWIRGGDVFYMNEELIYDRLQDELSRFIFTKRLQYRDNGDVQNIEDIVRKSLPQYHDYILEKADQKKAEFVNRVKEYPIVIFGAGKRGVEVYNELIRMGLNIDAIVDNYSKGKFRGNKDITVVEPEHVDYTGKKIVITPLGKDLQRIYSQLITMGVDLRDILTNEDYEVQFYCDNERQYFDDDIPIRIKNGEVFVDGGVYDLNTSRFFAEYSKKKGVSDFKILGFEADVNNYKLCSKRLQNEYGFLKDHLELMNFGLWNKEERVHFFQNPDGSSSSRIMEGDTNSFCNVVPLDNYFDREISFIKMDIEGAELNGLKGAQNVIRQYKPKLAICVYHKSEDIIDIPSYILQLVPEYRLYLRHYSNSSCETILYAVI